MATRKTHEQYVDELSVKNPSIIPIEKYVSSHSKILHKCLVDGHEWLISPANSLNGRGCPICGGTIQKTHKQYVDELKSKEIPVVVIGQYVNSSTKIIHKCLMHDYEWMATPNHILSGCGCPMCKKEKLKNRFKRNHDEYIDKVSIINKDIIVLGQYIDAKTPIKHKCVIDGWEWDALPDNILHGHGCPQCNKCSKSIGEKIISDWLDNHNVLYEKQKTFDDCKDKYVLRFDFYLSSFNILVEYNGVQHYEPVDYFGGNEGFKSIVKRDEIKDEYCRKNNIYLFKIAYFEDIYEKLEVLHNLIVIQNMKMEVII